MTVRVWPGPYPISARDLDGALEDMDGVLTMLTDPVDEPLLARHRRLRIVANMAVGYDNIDVEGATRHGVWVTHTPDVLTEATAELTWALILALLRGLVSARDALLAGRWQHWAPDGFLGRDVAGKTLGIVGWGRIGQAVAAKAEPFGMRVVALRTSDRGAVTRLDRTRFWATADVVSLHVPLLPATAQMVGETEMRAMRPGSYLVNTARGGLVDEHALLRALDDGHLAGAALDVFSREPIDGTHPLARHPRVVATPHIGSATVETRERMALSAADDLVRVLEGREPHHPVNRLVHRRGEGNGTEAPKHPAG